ncbi:hypothetical protein RchiOBHm_Chr2g0122281 [Rosa chinensis]|uniref:Uncharacterized protein n=1 Tax=Rosa chinensis TaxID=74649 RepID=A0A2P6RSR1_ROSCH|nr:hypothetical protein RchiOBHm_Chr2g0122281 [Rosa chinensis]
MSNSGRVGSEISGVTEIKRKCAKMEQLEFPTKGRNSRCRSIVVDANKRAELH